MLKRLVAAPVAAILVLPLALGAHAVAARSPHVTYRTHPLQLALPCQATNLAASLSWQGASGSLLGNLTLVNRATDPCTVVGRPTVLLLANGTDVLPVAITISTSLFSHFSLRRVAPVTIASGAAAVVALQWFNWCGAQPRMLSLIYALPAGGGGHVIPLTPSSRGSAVAVPRCDNSAIPSHLDVGLFQRPAGQ